MSIDNEEDIWYNYGVNGIQGITVNNVEYVFRKNVFGDVTHIYKLNNRNLTLAAKYTYDAWGKCLVENVGKETIGDVNPIRYRGYYYDKETELYYLNARYYDPEVGRFISADNTQYLEPNTVNGLNLYAYCASNPVMNVDPSGCFFLKTLVGSIFQIAVSTLSYFGVCVRSIWDEEMRADMNIIHWNPFNTNADLVNKATKVSFYYGVPVFKIFNNSFFNSIDSIVHNMTGSNLRSFSFGSIFLYDNFGDTIKHEIGHIPQQMILGPINFFITYGIPSMAVLGPWDYYDKPWEITASIMGGGRMNKGTKADRVRGWGYLALAYICPIFTHLFWFK